MSELENLARLVRYYILLSTTEAGSGHVTSSLSAVELMTVLFFGNIFRYDAENPGYPNNDRIIFSKGHGAPLFYSLWLAAGKITEEEVKTLRKFGSPFEGHTTTRFRYVEASTGSLGQGLSIGFGMALNAKRIDKLKYRTFVLLGDGEMAEGSQWEALQLGAYYRLNNLIGLIDVNRLGQRGETMYGHDLSAYERRISSFGWEAITIDGHDLGEIINAYRKALESRDRPVMIIARTVKGKGVSFIEDRENWHGKALKRDEFEAAVRELGDVDTSLRGDMLKPEQARPERADPQIPAEPDYPAGISLATRKAYGNALLRIFPAFPDMVVLDAEVSNSTFSEVFKKAYPGRFFEMFIAEQNMIGAALGLSRTGKIPFVSSFAAFLTRAFDQIRMSQYSDANIKFTGSHAGVSIGEDGASQMGLEDIAMFRTLLGSVVLYPCDALSTERLVEEAARHWGLTYIRTTRNDTPVIYSKDEEFPIGGMKVLRESPSDKIAVIAAGITLHEAIKAYEGLKREGILIRVIDLYCIKPIDSVRLHEAVSPSTAVVTVEDHYAEGGIGEAVRSALSDHPVPVHSLAVRKMPRSGRPEELLEYEEISEHAIVRKVREIMKYVRDA